MQVTHTLFFRFQHKHIEVASILPMMQVPMFLILGRTLRGTHSLVSLIDTTYESIQLPTVL